MPTALGFWTVAPERVISPTGQLDLSAEIWRWSGDLAKFDRQGLPPVGRVSTSKPAGKLMTSGEARTCAIWKLMENPATTPFWMRESGVVFDVVWAPLASMVTKVVVSAT